MVNDELQSTDVPEILFGEEVIQFKGLRFVLGWVLTG